jgi:GNAT superfamily N-acetyltransferase
MLGPSTDNRITVRRVTAPDAPVIALILRELGWFDWINSEAEAATEARVREVIESWESDGNQLALLAEEESGVPVGYAFAHCYPYMMLPGPELYLSELFVREAWRGMGVGRGLLQGVTSFASSKGCSRLMLVTGNDRDSYVRHFYQKNGWVERPHIANFIMPPDGRLTGGTRS